MPTIDGLVTGIDTTKIINGLLSIHQKQIDLLTTRKNRVVDQQTAFKGIEARLLAFRNQSAVLGRIRDSVFAAQTATSSNEQVVAAAASDSAVPGTYTLRVHSLAQAHQIASQGLADPDSTVTQGTFVVQVGSGPTVTITIDDTNNTLQGLADAINNSGAGVAATIVNDGSTGGTPYRMLLASAKTGAANALTVTNNLAADSGNAVRPVFDLDQPVQAAADASLTFGSGSGAITVQSETNQVENLIQGVVLNLLGTDDTKDVILTVNRDTETAQKAITEFVASFNDLMEYIDDLVRFDAATGTASILLGNRSVISIQDDVRRAVSEVVPGASPAANRLSALGITLDSSGHLSINSSKLSNVLAGGVSGVTAASLRRLFALDGQSDNGNIQFVLGGIRTKASTTPYQVDISQAAERASLTATNALAASTVIDASNSELTITVDGRTSATLALAAGTYTREQLAAHLEAVINADAKPAGRSISVSLQNDQLQITSNSYGNSSVVTIGTGSALGALGFAGSESDTGQDVVGTFVVDGVDEPATGKGRLLVGNPSNANTADLQVRVTLAPSQVQAGVDANVTVTRGIASRLDQVLTSLLDPVTGRAKAVNDGFDETAQAVQAAIDRQNQIFQIRQEALLKQFAALESSVGELQSVGNLLATQLSAISNLRTPG
ncbi:MAG: flagellar filament capping protein FliD [Planctomycetaceae bacterium]